jgi:Carboxypeptidase regulatory-like domain
VIFALIAAAAPRGAAAQVVTGFVRLTEGREARAAIENATVSLVDSAGRTAGVSRTDADGRYRLLVPEPGFYAVDVRRLGFAPSTSKWIDLTAPDTLRYDPVLEAIAVRLSAVTIRAERDELADTRVLGMNPRSLAGNFVTRSQLAVAGLGARSYGEVVQHLHFVWTYFDGTCVRYVRTHGCLTVYIDDLRMALGSDRDAQQSALGLVDPNTIDHMVLMRPADAGVLFGTGSASGVLLVYTHGYTAIQRRMLRRR